MEPGVKVDFLWGGGCQWDNFRQQKHKYDDVKDGDDGDDHGVKINFLWGGGCQWDNFRQQKYKYDDVKMYQ